MAKTDKGYSAFVAKSGKPIFYLYGGIGIYDSLDQMIDAAQLVADIRESKATEIEVRIASEGGSVDAAFLIFNTLVNHPATVTAAVDSVAHSAASLVLQAGDTRQANEVSEIMIHEPRGGPPWLTAGEHRGIADALESYQAQMRIAYGRHGIEQAKLDSWMSGPDHFFTSQEALAEGLIDEIISMPPAAALPEAYRIVAMGQKAPKIEIHPQKEIPEMADPTKDAAPSGNAAENEPQKIVAAYTEAENAGIASGVKAEKHRQSNIRAIMGRQAFKDPRIQAVLLAALDDEKCDKATAIERAVIALEALPQYAPIDTSASLTNSGGAFEQPPMAQSVSLGGFDRQGAAAGGTNRMAEGVRAALMIRAGVERDKNVIEKERSNEFLSMSLTDLMGRELRAMGHRVGGTREDIARAYINSAAIIAAGPSHGTDHLTGILADVANKATMTGWGQAEETWQQWTVEGRLNDYRTAQRANLALLDKLDLMLEHQEWEYGDLADVKQSITGYFRGKKYGLSIQAITNDDLSELSRAFEGWGEAASSTVGDVVFALLTTAGASGYGQTMDEDSQIVFHADHSNYIASGSGGAPDSATVGAARAAMGTQTDQNTRTVGIRPRYILSGMALTPVVWTLINSQTVVTGEDATRGDRNWVQAAGMVPVEEYRIDGWVSTAWFLAAARRTIEVSGVAGPLQPRVDRSMISNIPGLTYEMSMPFGAAVLDYRGLYLNYGA